MLINLTSRLVISLLMLGIVETAFAQAESELFGESMRRPFTTVPMGGGARIDGEIRKGEWVHFAKLHDFVSAMDQSEDNGAAAPELTAVYLTYDEAALYVGFKMHMEPGVSPAMTVTQARDTGFQDDAFEIFLIPEDDPGTIYHFGGTAAGVLWDRTIQGAHPDWTWNADVQYAVTVDAGNNWWMGEWRIPWAAMGRATPKDGEAWRANFCANRRSPSFRLDTWSYWKKWSDHENNGRLIFGGECLAMVMGDRWGGMTAQAFGGNGVFPAVAAPPGASVENPYQVDYHVELYRKPTPAGRSFLYDLQSLRDRATGEAATFATFEQDLKDAMKDYSPLYRLRKRQPIPPTGWTGPWGDHINVNEPGDYILAWRMTDVSDEQNAKPIAGGAVPFRVRVGIQATAWPYLLTRGSVVIKGDLRAVPERQRVKKLRGVIVPVGGGKALAEKTIDWNGEVRQELEIPGAASVPPGYQYEARLQALDENTQVISEAITTFNRPPDPDWWVKRDHYGAEPEVPQPWTAIKWDEATRTADVWGRQVVFGASALPTRITNQSHDTLAAPIELELLVGGQPQAWKEISWRVIESRPGHVLMESIREAGGVRLKTVTRFEFDGFSLVDLRIEPAEGQSPQIDSLDLVMPVRDEHATFLTNYVVAPGPGQRTSRYVGKTPDHYESPVFITTWLGTDNYGLEWSCESSKGWYITKPKRAIEVDRKGDRVEARFHLIDAAMTLSAPREIRFGLIPTPTKPVPPSWRNLRVDKTSYYPPIPGVSKQKNGQISTEQDVKDWFRQYGPSDVSAMLLPGEWSGYFVWHPHVTDPQIIEKMKGHVANLRAHGKIGLWNGGWGVAPYAPEWDPWGKEMAATPLTPTFGNQVNGTYASPMVEFMVGSWALNVRDLGLQGIRFDTVVPWLVSENPYLGETWTSDAPGQEGQIFGTQSLFRQRELFKRLYRVFNGQYADSGLFWLGVAGPPIMTVESFVHLHEIGEGFYMNSSSVKEAYPQDAVRVWMTHRAYGFLEQNNLKGKPLKNINRLGALLVADATPNLSGRDHFNGSSYKPANHEQTPSHRIWDAFSWIDRGTSQWCPHWDNHGMIKSTAAGEHYASLHLQPGRRGLLIVANYEKEPLTVTLDLTRAALGFAPDAAIKAQDAVTREAVPLDSDRLELSVDGELFRMVKIGVAEDLNGKNLDPLHPEPLP